MNKTPCGGCAHFDPHYKMVQGRRVLLRYGWCGKKSVYPSRDQDGQTAPPDAARAPEGELAKPVIVKPTEIVGHCLDVLPKG